MQRLLTAFTAIALVGCSFLDDFGKFTVRTGGTDSGPPDRDAGMRRDSGPTGATEGMACEVDDPSSCMSGLECIGACQRVCTIDANCTHPVFDLCASRGGGNRLCLGVECDPVSGSACPSPSRCDFLAFADVRAATACLGDTGTRTRGSSCTSSLECDDGLNCVLPRDAPRGECLPFCYPDNAACRAGETCAGLPAPDSEDVIEVDGRELGVCIIFCTTDAECPGTHRCFDSVFCVPR